jgi:N-acetylglucosaminyldiphosphoundecaprenol N-acetyl-beta-D-mannosaminyltransferase
LSAIRTPSPDGRRDAIRHPRVRFGSIWIDSLTSAAALHEIEQLVRRGDGGAVFTPNVDHVVTAEDDAAFRAAYARASLSLVDGQPLVWASRLLGLPLPERISGADLVDPLMQLAGRRGWRIFLVGGSKGAARAAAESFRQRHGVGVAGVEDGRVGLEATAADEALLSRIADARPHLVLVALGAPKQELWIDARRQRLAPAVAVGVGATLDFISGAVSRAPPWMRRAGLEWVYRLVQEPGRLARRYLWNDPRFLAILARTWLSPIETRRIRLPS